MSTRCFFFYLALVVLTASIPPIAQAQAISDEDAIHDLIGDYIEGWREADAERLTQVFALEEGRVMWVSEQDGEQVLRSMTFAEVLQDRRPQPEYGLDWEVLTLDIVDGELAVAKVALSRRGGSYIDILVMQKVESRWQIVTKTFVVRTREPGSQNP